ncbi:MAG: hypothetical protein MKZ76_12085 [Pedosphaera sp.]|nr:hypothetical protein [Pedosphaera sp.]
MKLKNILIAVLLPVFFVACGGETVSEDAPQGELPAEEQAAATALDNAGAQYSQSDAGNIEQVTLNTEGCDDALLKTLESCKKLNTVGIMDGTKITAGGISALKTALPDATVEQP